MIDAALARSIRLVALDVDGVMTDGGIYLGDVDGKRLEFKRYEIQDGLGIFMLRLVDIPVAIITGRVSESVRLRAAELGVDDLAQDPDGHKLAGFTRILKSRGVRPEEVAFVGDDFPGPGAPSDRRPPRGGGQCRSRGARGLPSPADEAWRPRRRPRVR